MREALRRFILAWCVWWYVLRTGDDPRIKEVSPPKPKPRPLMPERVKLDPASRIKL
jgi:hypothetical protein